MIILNFSHPLTKTQLESIETSMGDRISCVKQINSQIDTENDVVMQVEAMVTAAGLSPIEWQSELILVNLPSLNYCAAVMLSLLHGMMGYFPVILRLKPEQDSLVTRFVFAESINLQDVRNKSRFRREPD